MNTSSLVFDFPISTLVEDPAALPEPRPPLMKRMCCGLLPVPEDAPEGTQPERCDLVLGWVVCARSLAGEISHGICPLCSARWQEEAADMQAQQFEEAGAAGPAPRAATHADKPASETAGDEQRGPRSLVGRVLERLGLLT